jgi:hypothetical protein
MAINEEWHKKHKMPKTASMDEKINWHYEHRKVCGCRPPPKNVLKELEERNLL